jgi:hypothetical protein
MCEVSNFYWYRVITNVLIPYSSLENRLKSFSAPLPIDVPENVLNKTRIFVHALSVKRILACFGVLNHKRNRYCSD